jgi:hypothetical protein
MMMKIREKETSTTEERTTTTMVTTTMGTIITMVTMGITPKGSMMVVQTWWQTQTPGITSFSGEMTIIEAITTMAITGEISEDRLTPRKHSTCRVHVIVGTVNRQITLWPSVLIFRDGRTRSLLG